MPLDESVAEDEAGHLAAHNSLHDAYNNWEGEVPANFLKRSGGTMTGTITLADASPAASQAHVGTQLATALPLAGGTMTGAVVLAADATAGKQPVTWDQWQAALAGTVSTWHANAVTAATTDITKSGTQTINGVAVVVGNRVLLAGQATAADNGIWVVASGAWSRATDADAAAELTKGNAVYVEGGTLTGIWVANLTVTTVGTDPVGFAGPIGAGGLSDNAVTMAKLADLATDRLIGRDAAGTGDPTAISVGAGLEFTGSDGVGIADLGVTAAKVANASLTTGKIAATDLIRLIQCADKMTVFVEGGTIYARNSAGTIVSSATASGANNPTVIQAAIDAAAGVYAADDYGGGGTVRFGDYRYLMDERVLVKWGVRIDAPGRAIRKGTNVANVSFAGVVFKATTSLPTRTINGTTKRPLFQLGNVASPAGSQEDDNPHSSVLDHICIDMTDATNGQGVLIVDTHDLDLHFPVIVGPDGNSGGSEGACVEVISTVAPDEGALANRFHHAWFFRFRRGFYGSGTGSTDSEFYFPRLLQGQLKGIHWSQGGIIILGGHMTTGGTVDCDHIDVENGPTHIGGGIYLDTTGGYAVVHRNSFLEMNGFYIKCASGTPAAPIICNTNGGPAGSPGSNNSSKVQILNGKMQCSSTTKGLVQLCRTSGNEYRAIVMGNLIGTGGNAGLLGAAIDLNELAIPETLNQADFASFKTAMMMDLTLPPASANQLIAFNRVAISAI